MSHMSQHYEPEFKKNIVKLHLEDDRSLRSLTEEYKVSKATITNWINRYSEECQTNQEAKAD